MQIALGVVAGGSTLKLGLHLLPPSRGALDAMLDAVTPPFENPNRSLSSLPFASTSLAGSASSVAPATATRKEAKTGLEFPVAAEGGTKLAALGIRNKVLFGLKNVRVYAFGVYVNEDSLRKQKLSSGSILPSVIASDTELGVRLVIYYKGLKIGQVRSGFEQSLGEGIKAIAGAPDPQLLASFTCLFSDDFSLTRGTVIDITRHPGQALVTKIGGKEVGRVKSAVLCQAFFSLYLGEKPFDTDARKAAQEVFSSIARQ